MTSPLARRGMRFRRPRRDPRLLEERLAASGSPLYSAVSTAREGVSADVDGASSLTDSLELLVCEQCQTHARKFALLGSTTPRSRFVLVVVVVQIEAACAALAPQGTAVNILV